MRILYKPGPQLFTVDWLPRHNHKVNKHKEIAGMLNINAIETCMDISTCMTAKEIWLATIDVKYIGVSSNYMLHGWLSTKGEVSNEAQPYLSLQT